VRRLRLTQLAVLVMALIGLASVALIAYAVVDLYGRQAETDKQICVIVVAEWHQIERLGHVAGVAIPPEPPIPSPCLPA
jgi:hypothetical protein